ncbi:MAG: hypothetical protein KatS3mg125_1150 [Lysobacterales bacterium]|jgi:DNA helicase HerA-like ATPase|nr:MAG: hypothetical protein KatS3mg125_1150 [Xanthomonadales bacterium]
MHRILLGKGLSGLVHFDPRYGNRHGLVAGATGTGKSVSLMLLAEGFSRLGVPVFLADVKGDMAGLAMPGSLSGRIAERVGILGLEDFRPEGNPVVLWDLWGEQGHPLRVTVSEMGPVLLARIFELSDAQSAVLDIAFRYADEEGLLLLDLKDLRALLSHVGERRQEIGTRYGLLSANSLAAVQRALLRIENEGGERFFGEPSLRLSDLLAPTAEGRGPIHILAAERLIRSPRLYSSFLLWLLSELFEQLPEVGDPPLPKLVFFFDEAHLLFGDCPSALRQKIEQVVRLIRSKGVGVYFCSQLPDDVPQEILAQLGLRIQHGLRAFTPRDQKALKLVAETFVPNPAIDVRATLTTLGIGEALVSVLGERGIPQPVDRVVMAPPRCRLGPLTAEERGVLRAASPIGARYDHLLDRHSAYEALTERAREAAFPRSSPPPVAIPRPETRAPSPPRRSRQGVGEAFVQSTLRSIGSALGRSLVRGVLGSLLGGRRR